MEDKISGLKSEFDRQVAAQRLVLAASQGGLIKSNSIAFQESDGASVGAFLAAAVNSAAATLKADI